MWQLRRLNEVTLAWVSVAISLLLLASSSPFLIHGDSHMEKRRRARASEMPAGGEQLILLFYLYSHQLRSPNPGSQVYSSRDAVS